MKRLRQLHLYLGCIFAPLLILFAATGAVQMFGVRVPVLAEVHTKGYGSIPLMVLASLMGLSVVITSLAGVVMAFQLGDRRRNVWASLAFGTLIPLILVLTAQFKR